MTSKQFIDNCTACGGNWGGMLLTGINKLWPNVWEAIPDEMGLQAWGCLCSVLVLCGVETSEEKNSLVPLDKLLNLCYTKDTKRGDVVNET